MSCFAFEYCLCAHVERLRQDTSLESGFGHKDLGHGDAV